MRFYDYKCKKCNNVEEYYENTDDKKEHLCKNCGSLMDRQVSTAMYRFVKKKGLNLSATERKRRWHSQDARDKV